MNSYSSIRTRPLLLLVLLVGLFFLTDTGNSVGQFTPSPFGGSAEDPFEVTAKFEVYKGTNKGLLTVTGTIESPWYIYSITQPPNGPLQSEIVIEESAKFTLGEFEADTDPKEKTEESFAPVVSEYHTGTVNWSCPIEFAEGTRPEDLSIDLEYYGQRCADGQGCVRIAGIKAVANFAGEIETIDSDAPLRLEGSHLLISGKLTHEGTKLKPGDKAVVEVTLEPVDGYHVYEYSALPQTSGDYKKTLLAITKSYKGWSAGPVEAVAKDLSKVKEEKGVKHYEGPVTFKIPVTVGSDAESKEYTLRGVVGFMTCDAQGCTQPKGAKWEVTVPVAVDSTKSNNLRVTETGLKYADIETAVQEANTNEKNAGAWSGYSPAVVLPLAFVAGFILNFMPCVLPVVGLKIMSFMHMAGENPRRVFMLNFVFVLGMLAVFMTFAALAVMFNFGWGEAYTNLTFKVMMIAIVFGFGLSFFGVWEIPMPGIVDSDAANDLANKEGFVGQFFKGILTTLLATPCSGPMLIPAVVWAMAQPPLMTFTVFLALGLGMALPYLVIGAFPKLASFLPKPGGWMETFKQIMGFVLIATTIFLINGVGWKYNASVLTLLLFIGVGCWWIGRTELYEPFGKQLKAWAGGLAMIAVGAFIGFGVLIPWYELDYKPYSDAAVAKHLEEGRTVVVDFTADW